jgi:hypothetical protein
VENEEDSAESGWYNDIWNLLDITLMNLETDHRETFGLNGPEPDDRDLAEQWRISQRLDQLAPQLIESIRAFSVSDEAAAILREVIPGEEPARSLRSLAFDEIVQRRVLLELASDAISRLHDAEIRLWMLLGAVRNNRLSETATSFVDRCVRLFLAGFGPECSVMCRSALEAALDAALSDSRVAEILGRSPEFRHGFVFADRIKAARNVGLLGDLEVELAHRIRTAGNQAVHGSPGLAPAPEASILQLILVLSKLLPD